MVFGVDPNKGGSQEADFALKMTKLLTNLSQLEQELLGECLLSIVNAKDPTLSIFKATRAPSSVTNFNEFYLKGKNSILKNLPTPIPQKQWMVNVFMLLLKMLLLTC